MIKSNRINLKYLTGILNSKVTYFWLRHKGKMQGDLFQVDKAPILEIPIFKSKRPDHLVLLVDTIIYQGLNDKDFQHLEKVLNALVFDLYFSEHMKMHNINVSLFIESDINEILKDRDFEKLNTEEKERVIKQLHNTWTDPNNEVVKRIGMFREKSPDLLGVILDS